MKHKVYLIILFSVCILVSMYLIVNPISMRLSVFEPRVINGLESARNYYSVIYSVFAVIFGLSGLFLGYFYYESKVEMLATDLKRRRVETITIEINNINLTVLSIFNKCSTSAKDLNVCRTTIELARDNIYTMLDVGNGYLGFTRDEVDTIYVYLSYVDNNQEIMTINYRTYRRTNYETIKADYFALLQAAKESCYKKLLCK